MALSLATSTGTRVDSASKHIVPCKVSTDYMASLISPLHSDNPQRELQINKHRYSMAKDDVVVGLGRPLYGSSVYATRKKAYPSVITTLGQMEREARRWLAVHFFMCKSYMDSDSMKDKFLAVMCSETAPVDPVLKEAWEMANTPMDKRKHIKFQVENLLEFYVVGVSLGTAWAHPSSGDTVASVMIGGLRTILNGAFPIHTNDLVCIYFDDERDFFEENGGRKDRRCLQDPVTRGLSMLKVVDWIKDGKLDAVTQRNQPTGTQKLRKDFYEMGNGNYKATPTDGKHDGKIHVARIKPYIVSRHLDDQGRPQHFPADKARIFARAISNAMPWEKVDICISRQAI